MDLYKESPSLIVFDCQRDQIALEEFLIEKNISGRLFRRLYRRKDIYLNGKFVRKSTMLKRETGYPSTWRMRKITSPQKGWI